MVKRFATAINCMDGRAQEPVINYIKESFGVDYVDMITEPGPNKILSENSDTNLLESLRKRVDISINKHGSKIVAIIAHHDCAGNPVDEEEQKRQLEAAIDVIGLWNFPIEKIVALWLDENFKPRIAF